MGVFLLRFLPILLPAIIYIVWIIRVRNKARKAGDTSPRFRDSPWFWAAITSAAMGFVLILLLGFSQEETRGEYVPPYVENGKVVPGRVIAP